MSLGISVLTDDQLVELLQEACAELAQRDPIVRNAAQEVINTEAEKLKIERSLAQQTIITRKRWLQEYQKAGEAAVAVLRNNYLAEIGADIYQAVLDELKAEAPNLVTSNDEAQAIVDAAKRAQAYQLNLLNAPNPAQVESDRIRVCQNLLRMGHTRTDVERLYGKF